MLRQCRIFFFNDYFLLDCHIVIGRLSHRGNVLYQF
uniref:Uncharacterized protein n=1 Tax=Anguilla anguilla TaxID=7936 RepID=A0A0E9TDJ0_ANGAN